MDFNNTNIQNLQLEHSIEVNPASGSASSMVNIPLPEGRNAFGPDLSLHYGSSSRNSIFGMGWSLSGLSFISLDTKRGLPKYDGTDNFAFNGFDSIVPHLTKSGTSWNQKIEENADYWIYYYRSKNEDTFTRFEKWVSKTTGKIHWRTRSKSNIVSIYGFDSSGLSRICDPQNTSKIFVWLLESQYDENANAITYKYKSENEDNIDPLVSYETNRIRRFKKNGFAQKYLDKIVYGNTRPIVPDTQIPANNKWLFELVFDYGEYQTRQYTNCEQQSGATWLKRQDPFSVNNPGFEVRTYRLCRRLLIYHHFDELSTPTSLTGIFECKYNESESGTTLRAVSYTGVRRDLITGNYSEKQLPEITFKYTQPEVGKTFSGVIRETSENLPQGFNYAKTRLIDLFGEGIPGILTETANTWYYKPNLGNGKFGKQEVIAYKPSQELGIYSLGDFDQDGNLNLFTLQGRMAGYYEYDRDREKWSGFNAFQEIPQVGHSKFIDVNADGFADLVVECDDKIICYPFKGKKGFDKPFEFAKPLSNGVAYAPTIGDNLSLDYFLADMTGDGLPDQVRIKNGRVEYYPNLGNGHFGEVVLMQNSPVIDFDNAFDAGRIRLYDLDGSGTTDIIYIGNGELRFWYNASGNEFIEGGTTTNLPYIDNVSSAIILDFLGQGTPCLVWSNSLNNLQYSAIQYLELTNGIKPRLLTSLENGMGKEIQVEYGYSADHYLKAKKEGKAWSSKMPSHFSLVDKKIVIDHVTNSTFITQYKYRDGHYDGNERTFVTFGLVEQYDTALFENAFVTNDKGYAQPGCTKTWIHNGIFGWDARRAEQYYNKDGKLPQLIPQFFEQDDALEIEDFEGSYRSLAGKVLRQEIYSASSEGIPEEHPFQVSQNGYCIRKLQPETKQHDSCLYAYQTEGLGIIYEQNADDPKISHNLSLSVNKYGDIEKELSCSYARRSSAPDRLPAQSRDYITVDKHTFTNVDTPNNYQIGILFESKNYEVNHLNHDPDELIKLKDAQTIFDDLISNKIDFDQPFPTGGTSVARLTSWDRTYFWNDSFSDVLSLGQTGSKLFSHHEESACFNDAVISQAFNGKVTPAMLSTADEGNYIQREGYWWQRTAINHFLDADGFYNLARVEREAGNVTSYKYDPYHLNITEITDPLGNKTKGEIDYNIVEPFKLVDENDNFTEVLYDPLGVAIVTSYRGTVLDETATLQNYGNGLISDYVCRNDESFDNVLANPALYLQGAATFLFYDFDIWQTAGKPLRSIHVTRENLVHDGKGNVDNSVKLQLGIDYQDGFGRTIQSKQKVEPGLAIQRNADNSVATGTDGKPLLTPTADRWSVTGHIVYNNKQQIVRQFEPFFSSLVAFENDEVLENYGVSAQNYYDAVGRPYRTDFPDGTFTEVKFAPWETRSFDQNDTVERSQYKTSREILPNNAPERIALVKSLAHKDTPTIVKLDPLAREIVTIESNNDGTERKIENKYDINGNIAKIINARNLEAFEYKRDMLGRVLNEKSMDAGETWSFHNNLDQTIHLWDSRNIHQRTRYDELDRVVSVHVDGALGLNQITERFIYGEDPSVSQAKEKNLRGQLVKHCDQAGTQEIKAAIPGGNPIIVERKLLDQFTSEPNWNDPATVVLGVDSYVSEYIYDGLGRSIEQKLPDQITRKFIFNQGGGVQKILVSTADGVMNEVELLKNTSYDAKGMRQSALLGNDVEIAYTYDTETFLMKRLRARKISGTSRIYQDINYTYDPVGNLIQFVDEAQQPAAANPQVLEGLNVSALSEFEYDALYQLKVATGRVHQALLQNDYADRSREAGIPDWVKGARHITLNNGAAVERYTRTYEYDEAGNIKVIRHNGASRNWTKQIWTSPSSNRSLPLNELDGTAVGNLESRFDVNGNCIYMPHLRSLEWNYRNNISKCIVIDRAAQSKPNDEEYYVYGGDGMRVRKITQRVIDVVNDTVELIEKIYLDGCEIKRITRGSTEILKRFTSRITDGTNNIALVHSWETDAHARETDNVAQKKIHYQLSNHLGSAALELDENGDVITYEEYFPYGGTSFISGRNKREIELKDYRYSGKERDDFTGLYYFGYRYYAHWIGGWLSPDPIGPEDSENLYLYVHNNPINLVDPNGLDTGRDLTSHTRTDQLPTMEAARRYYQGRIIIRHGRRVRVNVLSIRPSTIEGHQWEIDGIFTPVDRRGRPIPPPAPPDPETSDAGANDASPAASDTPPSEGGANAGDGGTPQSDATTPPPADTPGNNATGAGGEAPGSTGTGRVNDPSSGGNNDSTGNRASQTQTNAGGVGNTGDGGNGDSGSGRGAGQRTVPGATPAGPGTTATGVGAGRGSGHDAGSGTGTRRAQGERGGRGNEQREGQIGGTGNTPGDQTGVDPNGSEHGSLDGAADGHDDGTAQGNGGAADGGNHGSSDGTGTGTSGTGTGGEGRGSGNGGQGGPGANPNGSNEEPSWWERALLAMGGAVYSIGNIFVEAGKQVYDMVGLGVQCIGIASGWYDYEHEVASGIGMAAQQGQSTGDIFRNMGRGIVETPGRAWAAAERGDWFAFGSESMNLYMLGRSAYSLGRGGASFGFNRTVRAMGRFGPRGSALRTSIRNWQVQRIGARVNRRFGLPRTTTWEYEVAGRAYGTYRWTRGGAGSGRMIIRESSFTPSLTARLPSFNPRNPYFAFSRLGISRLLRGRSTMTAAIHEGWHGAQHINQPAWFEGIPRPPGGYYTFPHEFTQGAQPMMGAHNYAFRFAPPTDFSISFGLLGSGNNNRNINRQ
jgi:RHS repeat-associated protein